MKKLYDPKCEELAHWFLDDEEPERRKEGDVGELAGVIQRAIEDWMEGNGAEAEEGGEVE
jgi:hypothetical protein